MRRVLFTLILLIFILSMSGCGMPDGVSESDIEFFNQHGMQNAYLQKEDGRMVTNLDYASIVYYIGQMPLSYKLSMTHAANEYSQKVQGINVNVTETNTNNLYISKVYYPPVSSGACPNPLICPVDLVNFTQSDGSISIASNEPIWDSLDDSKIVGSIISFNSVVMNNFSVSEKKHTALHELGHTFGLRDFYDPIYKNVSVMYGYYGFGVIAVEELYLFDIANLKWYYDDGNFD